MTLLNAHKGMGGREAADQSLVKVQIKSVRLPDTGTGMGTGMNGGDLVTKCATEAVHAHNS
jgi:hypothetical protein